MLHKHLLSFWWPHQLPCSFLAVFAHGPDCFHLFLGPLVSGPLLSVLPQLAKLERLGAEFQIRPNFD